MAPKLRSSQAEAVRDGKNPLLVDSSLPYGLPDFAAIDDSHVLPAFQEALRRHREEVSRIATREDPPTITNTIIALEKAGQDLTRVLSYFYTVASADATEVRQKIEANISPQLASHMDNIYMNKALFNRVHHVVEGLSVSTEVKDTETEQLVRRYYELFIRHGAGLDHKAQDKLRAINTELSTLQTEFGDVLLKDTQARAVHVTEETELAGVDDSTLDFFAATASAAGKKGWIIPLGLPSVQPIMTQLKSPRLRQRVYQASLARGGEHNEDIACRMATLRAEKAQLMGYATYADFVIADETAQTPDNVCELLHDLAAPAMENAQREYEQMTVAARADGLSDVTAADWPYYAEQVRKNYYQLDQDELKQYFRLDEVVRRGVFYAAEVFYNITIRPRTDLVGFTPETHVWEVTDKESGNGIGLLITDYFTRPTKRGGAWMNSIVEQNYLLHQQPIVINVLNINPPAAGEDAYLSLDEVETLFHEFGHALHGLFSRVTYPLFSGTNVPRDFVEFPSQFNEMWALHSDTLSHYARNNDGEVIPTELVEKIHKSREFGQGFATVEYLSACVIDMGWHHRQVAELAQIGRQITVADFENTVLNDAGLLAHHIAPRYRTRYYQHIFAGGYSAGYYSYIWSEVLDADTVDWVESHGGLNPTAGQRLRDKILSKGGSINYMDAYKEFRGREKNSLPLLRRRGLL